ncbi:MAG: SusC/RagA family TonB-linked outer membrane protein [Gemmatimonadaceae bacterium]
MSRLAGLGFAILSFAVGAQAQAQNAVITGRVASGDGRGIARANVYITELNASVATNDAGEYSIVIPDARASGQAATLRARAIGFTPQSRSITVSAGSQRVDFALAADVTRLSEVVVTGVAEGTQRAKLPFTVARLDSTDMPAPAMNPLTQLQGRVAGVSVVSTSGRPGQAPSVLLRAPNSINASGRSQGPAYVVDGVLLAAGLSDINPSDIESMEIIKGAAATSFYGATAGNGVIQITTKRGSRLAENSLRFGFRTEIGTNSIPGEIPLANNHIFQLNADGSAFCANAACTQTFNWNDEVLWMNSNATATPRSPRVSPRQAGTSAFNTFQAGIWPGQTYNAIDQVINPGSFLQNDLNMTGKYGQTNFFSSVGRLTQKGSMIGLDGYQRTSARVNVDQRIGDDFNVQLSTYYSRAKDDGAGQEGNSFFDLTRMPRGANLLMKDTVRGEYVVRPDLAAENENPIYNLVYQDRLDQSDRFIGGLDARYNPANWFSLNGAFSYDRSDNTFTQFNDRGFRTTRTSSLNTGQVFKAGNWEQNLNSRLGATFRAEPFAGFRTTLNLGTSFNREDFESNNATGQSLAVENVPSLNNARSPQIFISSSQASVRRQGYSANTIFDIADRYYVDLLIRRDGSSLFGPENRWHTFGRAAASWRLTSEPWFSLPGVDEFKLRYAIGTAGNSPSFSAQYETYTLSAGAFTPFTAGNKLLGPERLTEQEMGIDALFFGRLGATVTYSDVVTKDQILPVPLPAASGFQRKWENAGTMEGNTWEVSLDMPWIRRPDVSFSTRFNWDRSRATITDLLPPPFQYGVASQALEGVFYARKGERYGTMYGTRFATSCADLPTGTDCSQFRTNSDGYFVWTNGMDPGAGVTRNATGGFVVTPGAWGTAGPTLPVAAGCKTALCASAGGPVSWGTVIKAQDANGNNFLPLGSALPSSRWSVMPQLTVKRLTATALIDAVRGRSVYNQGNHWAHFENYSSQQDQAGRPDSELKPIAYYGSAGPTHTGLYNFLQPNSHFVEDGSFTKLREMTLSYHVGRLGRGDWTVSLVGRNLATWSDYSGFDPEVGRTGGESGTGVINAFDAYTFPNLRTITFGLQASF